MKLEVFREAKDDEVVRLNLRQDGDEIHIVTVDEEGNELDFLATISEDGIYLYIIEGDYGFACDDNGCLEVRTE